MIKAIETVYNGYRFRSRLEARWAVFFDAMGIEYRYEPEGFDLDGIWYLPDFWLPAFENGLWIEIKPHWNMIANEIEKLQRFVRLKEEKLFLIYSDLSFTRDGNGLLFLTEQPKTEGGYMIADIDSSTAYLTFGWFCVWYGDGVTNHDPALFKGRKPPITPRDEADSLIMRMMHENLLNSPPIRKAYKAARQARFEHGEKPN